ncbi:MAG: hypothetical protein P1T08_12820 [Acidimicrobiia bacterium]|nr:hypothetical protein [Acidimicrobiia bacterium]
MARTAITADVFTPNASLADPAGTAVDPTNGHIISGVPLEELVLRISSTFVGAKNFTIKVGANPPALEAGQGDLIVPLNAAVGFVGPFTSGRFIQADGSLHVDVEAAATGTITALHMPRTA